MTITQWPEAERPREKLLMRGAAALSDAELLAIFFRTGTIGRNAVDLARDLLSHFGGLRSLFDADRATFCHLHGVGPAKYVQLQAVLELSQRYLFEELQQKSVLDSFEKTKHYLISQLGSRKQEVFSVLLLDNRCHVIDFIELFKGSATRAEVYPGQLVKVAIAAHAVNVIIVHNHPSGNPTPSRADCQLTRELKKSLALVDIHLLDHIIVAVNQAISFIELGYL